MNPGQSHEELNSVHPSDLVPKHGELVFKYDFQASFIIFI